MLYNFETVLIMQNFNKEKKRKEKSNELNVAKKSKKVPISQIIKQDCKTSCTKLLFTLGMFEIPWGSLCGVKARQ